MGALLVGAVSRYLSLASVPDSDVMHAAAYAPRDELLEALTGIPRATKGKSKLPAWTSPARQLQRWKAGFTGSAKEQRGKKQTIDPARGIQRAALLRIPMIRRALLAGRTPAEVEVRGMIAYSSRREQRHFTVGPRTSGPDQISLDNLLAMQAVGRAADDGETEARNILTGIYFNLPPEPIVIDDKTVAVAPYSDTFDYEDCTFTIRKAGSKPNRKPKPNRREDTFV